MRTENNPPTPESEIPFEPQFNYTKELINICQNNNLQLSQFEDFFINFDNYLKIISERAGLLAIGIIAVDSTDTFGMVKEGYVLDAVTYWTTPQKEAEYDSEWCQLDPKVGLLGPLFFQSYSPSDYPSLEDMVEQLKDDEKRTNFTVAGVKCEYWGMVTTKRLREEIKK